MRKSIFSALAAGMAVLASLVVAPTASAAPVKNVIVFGDSYAANPDQVLSTTRNIDPSVWERYPSTANCLQAPNNWPRKLQQKTGAHVADWSCTGQTSRTMVARVREAIGAHALNGNTNTVVMSLGMNNFGPISATEGVNIFDWNSIRDNYLADFRAAAADIRRVAPRAKLVVAGTIAIADPATGMYCPVNVVPNAPMGLPVTPLRDVENANRQNQIDAARQIGAQFVDFHAGSLAHNTCAPDSQRWVAGMIDTTSPSYNMINHPTDPGSEYMANTMVRAI